MGYAFKKAGRVGHQVRAIATEQINRALEAVQADSDFDTKVHSLRKTCKKVRALLRLVRPHFDGYADENAAIRAIAEQFSVARDAAVMVQTLSGLLQADAAEGERLALRRLEERAGHLRLQMGEAALLANTAEQLEALRQRVAEWTFSASGVDVVLPGLKTTYAKFRRGFDAARQNPDGEVMHDWRKAAKAPWYHVRLWRKSAPAMLGGVVMDLGVLGEKLGDHHNLAVLAEALGSTATASGDGLDALRTSIAQRQDALAAESFAMARQFIVEKPAVLAERYRRYWQLLE